ncbi:MAG TPA: ribulose 1,5-bisphosphate carboxylase large subunit [Candidatus Syntrophoarchaeum butanivorans]|uniref:Ribulose 1,5-bisphosphate carboxylase large subunit n=2 Tax=Candidatus Syntropharchaeum butanivorans TaxID=1839936 RepID=A0A7J2S1I0_9EURY|nr:ribulose 1,5-bisphosphate carboxylase large subunit [Candidatus Syntrophoarchaeum butanivorans]
MDYLAIGEDLDPEGYIFATYRVKTDLPIEKAARAIAAEQSTGTWTDISTASREIITRLGAKVTEIANSLVKIAYPLEDFDPESGGIPQLLSVVAGNLFGLEDLEGVRLEDLEIPDAFAKNFSGPAFGIEGLRKVLDRWDKPLVGTIVKPKIGLPPEEFAAYVYEAGMGGLTNSKDDETLVNQRFCPLAERTAAVADALDRIFDETGHRMIHAINVSSPQDRILELAELAAEHGARQIMVDILTCGFDAVRILREDPSIKLPIHVHRTMHGALTRNPDHGIAMAVIAKIARLCGADALHIGTFGVGKMHGSFMEDEKTRRALIDPFCGFKEAMPVCSGGIHPGLVPELIRIAGTDIQIQAGGGVSGHPGGVRQGAMAMCEAVDAALEGVPLEEYGADHEALRAALKRWGGLADGSHTV